jgi:hypothetical protein
MKFGSIHIPESLHQIARERMLQSTSFTPDEVRSHLLDKGIEVIAMISDLKTNQWIVANNVVRAEINKLVSEKAIGQLKRGVWMKRAVLDAQ